MTDLDFREEWMLPYAVVPVDVPTTSALLGEIKRMRETRQELLHLELSEFLKVAGKNPDLVGIPVFYAEWPRRA